MTNHTIGTPTERKMVEKGKKAGVASHLWGGAMNFNREESRYLIRSNRRTGGENRKQRNLQKNKVENSA